MKKQVEILRVVITPEMAKLWLEKNITNRKLRRHKTEAYARTMKAGLWLLTNQGIGFDTNGNLIDGQHRLYACIMANTPFPSYVAYGLETRAQRVIDGGITRSVPDQLHLDGMENTNAKVAIITCIVGAIKGMGNIAMSLDLAEKVIDLYSDEIEFIFSDRGTNKALKYAPAIAGFILAAKTDLDLAVEFKDKYFKGHNLSPGDPSLTFRNFMINRNMKGNGGSDYRKVVLCFSATAMMYYFQKKPLRKLTTSTAGLDYFLNKQKACVAMIQEWLAI